MLQLDRPHFIPISPNFYLYYPASYPNVYIRYYPMSITILVLIMNMSQSYSKSCMFCKREIVMSDRTSGNWLPYDLDGQIHDCKATIQEPRR